MLQVFGFERVGVLVSDLYIVLENSRADHEGAEHGVRLEVRLLERLLARVRSGELAATPDGDALAPVRVGWL